MTELIRKIIKGAPNHVIVHFVTGAWACSCGDVHRGVDIPNFRPKGPKIITGKIYVGGSPLLPDDYRGADHD